MKKAIVTLMALLLLCSAVSAQQKLKVVVSATGAEPPQKHNTLKLLETKVQEAFFKDGRYIAVVRDTAAQNRIDREHVYQRSGAVDERQIAEIGKASGAKYMCQVKSYPVAGTFMLEARLVDLETHDVVGMGSTRCDLVSVSDLSAAGGELVRQLMNPNSAARGGYGSGLYWDRESVRKANPIAAELTKILTQKVSVSEGTCVSGSKIAIESDSEPDCSEGMVGVTCKLNAALVVTRCQGDQKTVLKGTVTGVDKSSKDAALKQVMRNAESAKFWDAWVKDLEAKGKK